MSKHTPKPWYVAAADEWRDADGQHIQFGCFNISAGSVDPRASDYYRIASVSNVNDSWQNEANARLIAAAPELLESLRDLVQLEADGRTEYESAIEHWERARAAIAKATHGEPT